MDSVFHTMERDEYGLPILPGHGPEPSEEEMDSFMDSAGTADFFTSLGMPAPPMPTVTEVRREARERAQELLSDWKKLRLIVERHEEVIRKRWIKKTKKQRTAILLEAWPNMSPTHRPDYTAFAKEGRAKNKSRGTKSRECYVWPYINLEDLTREKPLLLFLNSRGRHPPETFAHADLEATHLGQVSFAIALSFLNVYTMFLNGETVETYGKLVSWNEDDEASQMLFNRLAHQPGEGLLILEIQQRVLKFLVRCCQAILHDFDPMSLVSNVLPIKPEPSPILDNSEFPTLASLVSEAPYRLPASLNFKRLQEVISARKLEAEEHVWSLREDPGYFADAVREWSHHRQETLLDTEGARHPVLDTPIFWDRVVGSVVEHAYCSLIVWDNLSEQISNLIKLERKYSHEISPQRKLPSEYETALLTLRHSLDQVKKGPISLLKTGIPASPPLRSMWVREPQVAGSTMIQVHTREGGKEHLILLFATLWDDQQMILHRFPDLMDELEKTIQSDPKQKELTSPWVAGMVADLGLMARARHELDIYFPWAAAFEASDSKPFEEDFPRRMVAFANLTKTIKEAHRAIPFSKLGTPTGRRFYYPVDKRRTKQTTDEMRQAEQNLDMFWEKIDDYFVKRTGKTVHGSLYHLFPEERKLERTPEWIEPIKEEKTSSSKSSTIRCADPLQQPLSQLNLGLDSPSSKITHPKTKVKIKTKGEGNTSISDIQEPQGQPQTSDPQSTINLSNRAFKVFKTLFFNPSQSDLPGEIPWIDFLHAMAATGFAPEKLYGSIWQFTPSRLDVERSIQFHEPHPKGKIPFRNARRIGRRLNRAYGWHGGMFVLE